jgi:hypothetical protein
MKRKRKDMGDAKMLRSEEVKRPFIIMHSDDSPHWEGAMIADWAAESISGVRRAAGQRMRVGGS